MAEQLDLTVPVAPPTRTFYRINRVTLDWDNAAIRIDLTGSDSVIVNTGYDGVTATALMLTLNTSNLSTISLQKRILNKLVADGKLPSGIVSGTP